MICAFKSMPILGLGFRPAPALRPPRPIKIDSFEIGRVLPTAIFQVLSAEAATKHGPNIHCLIIDELHAQPDRELFETLTRGIIARSQPLILLITTAGDDDESICYEEYDYAKRVLSGTITDEQHLPVIFEAGKDDDPFDPVVWARVNPALGETVDESVLAGFANEARHEPRKRNDFLRYNLNRWTNQATAWIPIDWWDACEPVEIKSYQDWLTAQTPELAKLPCAAGLDLAQKIDLACFAVVFRERIAPTEALKIEAVDEADGKIVKKTLSLNYRITVVPYFWIPEDTMREHEKNDGVPYSHWKSMNLRTTEGSTIDYDAIFQDITTKILPTFPLLKQGFIGYDPAFATDIASELAKFGLKVEEILQNYKYMSEPCYIAESLIKSKRVSHGGNRVLRNHWENVAIKQDDALRVRPVRPKKASKHIDGVVSTLMGIRALAKVPDRKKDHRIFFMGGQHAPAS